MQKKNSGGTVHSQALPPCIDNQYYNTVNAKMLLPSVRYCPLERVNISEVLRKLLVDKQKTAGGTGEKGRNISENYRKHE